MDVQERASTILGCKADIMTRDSLHKVLRDRIEATAMQRGVEIISEASRALSEDLKARHSGITWKVTV